MYRKQQKTVQGFPAVDGAGVHLVRVLGAQNVHDFDPFLLLDAFDSTNPDDYTKGFPWHPHRGIETITFLSEGQIEHGDNIGNKGMIEGGSCQWLTAGKGIIHQEMPKASKRMLGLQLWLNLPAKDKMCPPQYNDLPSASIPVISEQGTTIRIIAGEYKKQKGAMQGSYVDATILEISMTEHSSCEIPVPEENTVFLYGLEGTFSIESTDVLMSDNVDFSKQVPSRIAVLLTKGDRVRLTSKESKAHIVLVSGKPLREPIAWGGPIVMNTKEELEAAFEQLDNGTFIR